MATVYCKDCGREVDPISVSMGTEGIERLRCPDCGAFLEGGRDEFAAALQEEGDDIVFSDESISVPIFNDIYLVGYSDRIGRIIENLISQKNIAREIHTVPNGEELIIQLIERLNNMNGDNIGLVVMDVPMPYLNGINAAIAMRAVERTYSGHKPIPILFLTQKSCDDTFKKVIKYLSPAKYAGMGKSEDVHQLTPHLSKVISLIAHEKW